ncbi:hypothetical protein AUC43_07165 [Hymenobacter sedentarius]|uniref:Uncharacterized protein n=1 Tax=Hymenobacter sedentarius TaxID=1411621 RepID=A0A0U4C9P7_9BACT|nr:hypothetical protein AUC43_07165 [Hymenobacter sedentarius]
MLSAFALVAAPAAHAQVNITPPSWGPAVPAGAQYYYIPETNGFYDVPARQYIVSRNGQWVRTTTLSGYDPSDFHPVVVDYVGAQPWTRYDEYRNRYPRGGNPSNGSLPPGQAKKQGYRANPSNGGLPPGQAKKQYRDRDDDRNRDDRDRGRNGGIYVPLPGGRLPDGRYPNDRRDDRRYDSRNDHRDDRRNDNDDNDDDRGKGHGKGKSKGKDRD